MDPGPVERSSPAEERPSRTIPRRLGSPSWTREPTRTAPGPMAIATRTPSAIPIEARLAAAPVVPLAGAFAAGIAAAGLAIGAGPALAVATILLAGALGAAERERPRVAAACLVAAVAGLGLGRGAGTPLPADHVARLASSAPVRLEGRLGVEPVRLGSDRLRVVLDIEAVDAGDGRRPATGRVQLTLY